MKKQFLVLAWCLVQCAMGMAQGWGAQSKVVTDSMYSETLKAWRAYNVFIPRSFAQDKDRQYPVLYLLHGMWGTNKDWDGRGHVKDVMDQLVASGEACEMIIVMPNAGGPDTHNTWNGYFNMPGWNYEDFFFQEFVPAVEMKYHTVGDKGHRAVMGLSMGGGGSTVYCQRHPDMFSSCYAMSAWLDNQNNNVGVGQEKDKRYYVSEAVKEHSALRFVEQADDETKKQLRTVKWFFDCGDDDFLFDQSVRLHQLMRNARIKDELRIRNGVHNWEYWHLALRMALPFASRNFE